MTEPYLQVLSHAEAHLVGAGCMDCRHLLDLVEGRCLAFPDQIPSDILQDLVRHTAPYPGDHGLRFEPAVGLKG
jgi:hypothetical protein